MTVIDFFDDDADAKAKAAKEKAASDAAAAEAAKKADDEAKEKAAEEKMRKIARDTAKTVIDEEIEPAPTTKKTEDAKGFALVWMLVILAVIALASMFAEGCVPVVVVIGDADHDVTCKQSNTSTEPLGELIRFEWWFPNEASSTPATAATFAPATPATPPRAYFQKVQLNTLHGRMR